MLKDIATLKKISAAANTAAASLEGKKIKAKGRIDKTNFGIHPTPKNHGEIIRSNMAAKTNII